MRRGTFVAGVCALVAAVQPGPVASGGTASTSVWSGTWAVEIGPTVGSASMSLTQNGADVVGSYLGTGGSVSGTASGPVLSGTWQDGTRRGQFVFTLGAGGGSFTGIWKDSGEAHYGGTWNGVCQGGSCALGPATPAAIPAPSPPLVVGGVEDAAEWGTPARSLELARRVGFQAIVLSAVWNPPLTSPPVSELDSLAEAAGTAKGLGIEPVVAVYSFARNTPLSARARAQFASYAAAIVRAIPDLQYMSIGNEPNSGVFWLPQFGAGGSDVAAAAYYQLLSETDAVLRRFDPGLTVIGGSLASRGSDRPGLGIPSHSPTRFIEDLGAAFRASGASTPPMDMFSLHPYPPNSSVPPSVGHPGSTTIGIADYDKLVALLRGAFGAPLPIVYGEYGINTLIPPPERHLYTGRRAPTIDPVSAATQGADYVEAIRLAACQPLVRMLLFFHVTDEASLTGLQSGLYYPNNRPKPSLAEVARWARDAASGAIRCGGGGGGTG